MAVLLAAIVLAATACETAPTQTQAQSSDCIESPSEFCNSRTYFIDIKTNPRCPTSLGQPSVAFDNEVPERLVQCALDYCQKQYVLGGRFPDYCGYYCGIWYDSNHDRLMDLKDLYAIDCRTLERVI